MKKYIRSDKIDDDISKVSLDELRAVIDSADREGHYRPYGKFYAREGDAWVAVDNSTGCAWTEEFRTEKKAIAWLNEY